MHSLRTSGWKYALLLVLFGEVNSLTAHSLALFVLQRVPLLADCQRGGHCIGEVAVWCAFEPSSVESAHGRLLVEGLVGERSRVDHRLHERVELERRLSAWSVVGRPRVDLMGVAAGGDVLAEGGRGLDGRRRVAVERGLHEHSVQVLVEVDRMDGLLL